MDVYLMVVRNQSYLFQNLLPEQRVCLSPQRLVSDCNWLGTPGLVLIERIISLHSFVVGRYPDSAAERPVLVESLVFVFGRRWYVVAEVRSGVICKAIRQFLLKMSSNAVTCIIRLSDYRVNFLSNCTL